jgi:predicted dehydrogenase
MSPQLPSWRTHQAVEGHDSPASTDPNASTRRPIFCVGIVGAGSIVQQVHIPVLRALENVRIFWVFDSHEATAKKVARANGVPLARSQGTLATLPPVDVILLAVPWGARSGYYDQIRALPEKPGLFVEKPFARSIQEHRGHVAGFANWQVAIGHTRRVGGPIQFARHLVASGALGAARKCEVCFGGLGRILTRGGYYGDLSLAGGGILMEMGTHYLDAAFEVLDARDLQLADRRIIDHAGFDAHVEGTFNVLTARGLNIPLVCRFSYLEAMVSRCVVTCEHATLSFDIDKPGSFEITGYDGMPLSFSIDQSHGPHDFHATAGLFWETFLNGISKRTANAANADAMALVSRAVGLLYGEES